MDDVAEGKDINHFSLVGLIFIAVAMISFGMFIDFLNQPTISYTLEGEESCLPTDFGCISEKAYTLVSPLGLFGTIIYGFSGWALYKRNLSKLVFWSSTLGSTLLLIAFPIGTFIGALGLFKLYSHREEFE